MQTEIYTLKQPAFIDVNGGEIRIENIEIKPPTGRCRTAVFQLKQIFSKAQIDLSILSSNAMQNNESIEQEVQKAQEQAKKKERNIEDEIESVMTILYTGGADLESCLKPLSAILEMTAKINCEDVFKKSYLDEMQFDDVERLLGFYIANFM